MCWALNVSAHRSLPARCAQLGNPSGRLAVTQLPPTRHSPTRLPAACIPVDCGDRQADAKVRWRPGGATAAIRPRRLGMKANTYLYSEERRAGVAKHRGEAG